MGRRRAFAPWRMVPATARWNVRIATLGVAKQKRRRCVCQPQCQMCSLHEQGRFKCRQTLPYLVSLLNGGTIGVSQNENSPSHGSTRGGCSPYNMKITNGTTRPATSLVLATELVAVQYRWRMPIEDRTSNGNGTKSEVGRAQVMASGIFWSYKSRLTSQQMPRSGTGNYNAHSACRRAAAQVQVTTCTQRA